MVSKTAIMFGIIAALASALTGVVVYTFTEKSQQPTTVIQTATPTQFQGVCSF